MNKRILIVSSFVLLSINLNSCNSGTSKDGMVISKDSGAIAKGEISFDQNCSGCHNFKQDGIGPHLGGLTDEAPVDWIQNFIRDPKKMFDSGDMRSLRLYEKYKVMMPSFSTLTDAEVNNIVAFMHTHKKPEQSKEKSNEKAILDPIPDTIALSSLVVELKLAGQIPPSVANDELPLTRITKLDFRPRTNNLFVVDLRGKLYSMQENDPVVYIDMAKLKPRFIDKPGLGTGFGSFAFHPDFEKNGYLYTTHTEAPDSGKADFSFADSIKTTLQWVLTEWKTKTPDAISFSGTDRELLRIDMVTGIHGVQEIIFNPLSTDGDKDYGMLYIGVGDGGSVGEGYPFLVQDKDKVWGTILRIDPRGNNSTNRHYGIPPDNPFTKNRNSKTPKEIYATGFRNPHHITWAKSGDMLASNIGQRSIESLNLIMSGHDYGWPIREGTFVLDPNGDLDKVYPLPVNDSVFDITYPIAQYDHSGGGAAISGGYEYQGTTIPQLKGRFLFGDIPLGKLFFIEMAAIKQGTQATIREWKVSIDGVLKTLKELCGSDRVDLHFGRDAQGELYILTKPDGKIYKLVGATSDSSSVDQL